MSGTGLWWTGQQAWPGQAKTPVLQSYDGIVVRGASVILAALAAAAAIGFVALYLGGYPEAFAHERMALVPLIAGVGAAVLDGYRRGNLPRRTTAVGMILLAAWAAFLRFPL